MGKVGLESIKKLRDLTGAGIADCKDALNKVDGDIEKAIVELRKQGAAILGQRQNKETSEGIVATYSHPGNRIASIVELNCETDFVAKSDGFLKLGHELAMQVAAAMPEYMSKEQVPEKEILQEKEVILSKALAHGKKPEYIQTLVEAKIKKYYAEVCLLDQPFIKNPEITIQDLLNEASMRFKENIKITRFVRYRVGEHE